MQRYGRAVAIAVAALAAAVGSLGAQQVPTQQFAGLEPGMRIRVTSSDRLFQQKISGTVIHVSSDSLVLDTLDMRKVERRFFPQTVLVESERRVTLPVYDVDSVDISMGTSRAMGMLKGAGKAAVIGGAIVGLSYIQGVDQLSMKNFSKGFRSGTKVGAVAGLAIGFSYGSERWNKLGKLRPSWLKRGSAK